jgi:Leucine-rich repeat (LRR) protein
MIPEFIRKLIDTFQIEIIRSKKPIKWENTFDLDINNNVRSLYLDEVKIQDLTIFVPIASHLTELSITRAGIENLGIIKSFTQLEFLDLSFNPIQTETLSNLCSLKSLKKLYLEGTNITDTSALGGVSNLESLYLGGSDVLDRVNGLERLKMLKHLSIEMTQITDIKNVHVSDSIRSLNMKSSKIDKIRGLDRFIHLEELKLNSSGVEKIEGLDELKELKRLNLYNCNITEIQGLENLKNLEILDLGYNNIREIKGVNALVNLKELNLSLNKLKKLENLDGLVNLTRILLDANKIEVFNTEFLYKLVNHCVISLSHNPIQSLQSVVPDKVELHFGSEETVYRILF